MKTILFFVAVIAAIGVVVFLAFGPVGTSPVHEDESVAALESAGGGGEVLSDAGDFVGSSPCRDCHEDFYELWAPSLHGLAMQPFTPKFAQNEIDPQDDFLEIGPDRFRVELKDGKGWVLQEGPEGKDRFEIQHVLGGKNVYYFLAPMARGHLQVLPLAFDVRQREWFDTAGSAVRHFADMTDEALDWKDRPYTFNTSCFNCHVSQLEVNYSLENDSYHTVWAEPGINCETCHGPAGEHLRLYQEAAETGETPEELKIISVKDFDIPQTNTLCAPCHAKMAPLTDSYLPGDRYFDHYDLFMLEDADFYPDGRDLGENYTFTGWRMNSCAKSGQMSCLHCHTASGRTRFEKGDEDSACLPCHVQHVENPADHSHHPAESEGSRCFACHMPKTTFARMERHDHTMLGPTPATTIAHDSPNACNICHEGEDAQWANEWVGKWYRKGYQEPILYRAALLDSTRKRDWSRLDDTLAYITSDDRDEVFAASLIRLLESCPLDKKWPAIIKALHDESPLVRSSAARSLGANLTEQTVKALLEATSDGYRVVRIHAGASLASYPQQLLGAEDQSRLQKALGEYEASLMRRPDHATSHYNLGNFYSALQRPHDALDSYKTSSKLQPDSIMAWVNSSMVHARLGQTDQAEKALRTAIGIDPASAEANFNLGLLLAEKGDLSTAEKHLRIALKTDPTLAEAAYNLGIMLAEKNPAEAVQLCRKAFQLRPDNTKYAYTLAFYLDRSGQPNAAAEILQQMITHPNAAGNIYAMLAMIYEKQGKTKEAIEVYRKAMQNNQLTQQEYFHFQTRLNQLQQR